MSELDRSLDRLATLITNGHLMASACPDKFIDVVVDEIQKLRDKNHQLRKLVISSYKEGAADENAQWTAGVSLSWVNSQSRRMLGKIIEDH